MKTLKNIIIISFSLLIGLYVGLYIYRHKEIKAKEVINTAYLLQYGVYKQKESMILAGSKLSDYFYYSDDDGYHIIIGIVINKDLEQKIKDSYKVTENIYLKKVSITDNEFYESLKQYDTLIEDLNSDIAVINAEKQILSKYEELILENEGAY